MNCSVPVDVQYIVQRLGKCFVEFVFILTLEMDLKIILINKAKFVLREELYSCSAEFMIDRPGPRVSVRFTRSF